MTHHRAAPGALALVLLVAALAVGPAAAAHAIPTSIRFSSEPVAVAYGEPWFAQLTTTFVSGTMPIPQTMGSVEVFASGLAEPIASDLPLQPDGTVYVAAAQDAPLAPGTYELTAIFHPAEGSGLDSSQTSTPLSVVISSYSVTATLRIEETAGGAPPILELGLEGEYIDEIGARPIGTWVIRVSDGDEEVSATEVAQPAEVEDPVRLAIDVELELGREYRVEAEFAPVAAIADGLEVTQPDAQTLRTRDGTVIDTLGSPVPVPWWLLALSAVIPLGLLTAAIILTFRLARQRVRVEVFTDEGAGSEKH